MRQHNLSSILTTNAEPEMKLAAAVLMRGMDDVQCNDRTRMSYKLDALDFFDTMRCYGWISIAFPTQNPPTIQRMIWAKLFAHVEGTFK